MSPPDPPNEPLRGREISPGEWPDLIARVEGTQLIIGGPGTGKTELLARRAAHLINSEITPSDGVLAFSFSRETAADLRSRITSATRRSFGELSIGTFHAFARGLVEENCRELLGVSQPPMLLTTPEQIHFVKEALADEPPGVWPLFYRRMLHTHTLAEELADFMLRCGERRITHEELAAQAEQNPAWAALPGFYQRYLDRLRSQQKIDYTGLLLLTNHALGRPGIGSRAAARFPYVLVDEFQEATVVQVEILKKLVEKGCHLIAVADPHQTSFSFRGAERASVPDFPEAFSSPGRPSPQIFTLDQSFRISPEVLDSAGALLEADHRFALPAPASHTGKVDFYLFDQETTENDWIASEIKRLRLTQQLPYSQMAVLVRAARLLPRLSRALDREGIPHGRPGARLIDHPAVRLALDLAWVSVVDNHPHRSRAETEALDRVAESLLLGPLFSVTRGRARELGALRRESNRPWSEVLAENLRGAGQLSRLLGDPSWANTPPATNGFWKLWSRVPQFQALVESDRLADYRAALVSFAQTLGRLADRSPGTSLLEYRRLTLEGDLEASPLLSPPRPTEGQVTISTIHRAKGRQFEVVFIAGATEGVFPDTRPFRSLLEGQLLSRPHLDFFRLTQLRLEEERSLAYIAMTRAHRRVVWTATSPDLNEVRRTVSRFMLSLSNRSDRKLQSPVSRSDSSPVGRLETETFLRRIQQDARQTLPRRLAAGMALTLRSDLWDARGFAGMRRPGSDFGLIDPNHIMSASQADAYKICPRRYALESRLRIRPTENSYLMFGNLIHKVLQKSGERSFERGEAGMDLSHALDTLYAQLDNLDFGTPVLNRAWRNRGETLLGQLAERWPKESGQAIRFEEKIDIELGGIPWSGRVDRIDRLENGSLRIVDYKSSKKPMTHKEAEIALQLGFYLWMLSHRDPDTKLAAEFWYPLFKGTSWKRSFDTDKLEKVAGQLGEIAQAILSEGVESHPGEPKPSLPWQPRPSKECGRCQVRSLCPAWPEGQGAFVS